MLLEAADAGDIATVRAIVGAGGLDLDAADDVDSYSALLTAAEAGHADVVGALLDAGASVDAPRDSYGRTPLCAAAVAGRADVVERLVAAGADVDAADGDGRSVLWATCALRHLDVAAILARGACDVDAADADGDTALDFAVKHGHADVADFARRRGAADRNAGRLYGGALKDHSGLEEMRTPKLWAKMEAAPPNASRRDHTILARPVDDVLGGARNHVDLYSLDVEGAELSILEHFPFDKIVVELWFVETNKLDRVAFVAFMESKGYSCHHYDHVNSLCQLNKHRFGHHGTPPA
ncbi:hypothetical protein JL720_10602 [Aureococcus anophagefferens]|nr:hypothetical protein JL720_10602 [Aureococcus anophagefferens]